MSIEKFRLLWRNSPQRQADSLSQMTAAILGMRDVILSINNKMDALPAIKELVQLNNTLIQSNNDLQTQNNLLLTQVADNTNCACEALGSLLTVVGEIRDVIDVDTEPGDTDVYVLEVPDSDPYYDITEDLQAGDTLSVPFTSTLNGVAYSDLEVIQQNVDFGDVTFDAVNGLINIPIIADKVYVGYPVHFYLIFKQLVSEKEIRLEFRYQPPYKTFDFSLGSSAGTINMSELVDTYVYVIGNCVSRVHGVNDGVIVMNAPDWLNPNVSYDGSSLFLEITVDRETPDMAIVEGDYVLQLQQNSGDSTTLEFTLTIQPDYALIAGVKWSRYGLISDPADPTGMTSMFASRMDTPLDFYQWGRKKAWPSSGDVSGWDSSNASGSSWLPENDPCPAGWRLPTFDEYTSLFSSGSSWRTGYAVPGRFIGVNHASATLSDLQGCIFVPVSGYRNATDGVLTSSGSYGRYWSDFAAGTANAFSANFDSGSLISGNSTKRGFGYNLFCVKDE